MPRLEAIIFGKVQGVTYRSYVAREGLRMGLTGKVENLSDNTIQVIAEGSRVSLQSFVSRLYEGPGDSKIEKIETKWSDNQGTYKSFDVGF